MAVSANSLQLSGYLEAQQGTTFRRLYGQPSTTLAIFRSMLPKLAKCVVMAMLYMPTAFLLSDLDAWFKPTAKKQKDQALSILRSLHIVTITAPSKDVPQSVTLRPEFKISLRLALEGGGKTNSFGVRSKLPVPDHIDVAFLDSYARKKWDDILYFVVNSVGLHDSRVSGEGGNGPGKAVKELLVTGGLVERKAGGSSITITQSGFTFLLQEANAQVWTVLLLWLGYEKLAMENNVEGSMDAVDMLSFLFLLASLQLGRAYSTESLPEARRHMLIPLMQFGLVYVQPNDKQQYFPTRLATSLTSSETGLRSVSSGFNALAEGGGGEAQERSSIILETNFRVYGYTSSPLQIAVLALFCDLKMRFRGLVSGKLTRQSIRRAVDLGITSDQIISYLASHAHEQMHRDAAANKKPLMPPVIIDQIRLWQLDTERMSSTEGLLFKEFDSAKEYKDVVTYADEIGVVEWRSDAKRMFFVRMAGFNQVKDYVKNRKKEEKASQ